MRAFCRFKTPRSTIPERYEDNLQHRHGFRRTPWREIEPLETERQVHGNAKVVFIDLYSGFTVYKCTNAIVLLGWRNGYLSIQFLRFHFAERPDPTTPILLLWDDFSGH